MDNSRMMALLVAGSMICGGFAASAADEAKKAETAKPAEAAKAAETVKPAETKPEDLFAVVPAVVAEVKGEKITKDMLVAEVMKMFPNGKIPEGVTADNLKAALPGIVKQLVIQKIFETEMAKAGIKPSAEMVKEKIGEEFKKMDKQMLAMITQQLQMQNKTVDQYIDEMSKEPMAQQQIANQMYLEEKVLKNLKFDKTIPADAAKKYYDENAAQFMEEADKPDQIRASHILIAPDGKDDAADKKAQEKAAALLKQLKENPKLFEELAKENSTCPSSARGGSLGAFGKGQMVPEFEKATLALKPGEISAEPVKTQFGYHIIRRDALQTEGTTIPFEKVKGDIESFLKAQKDVEEKQQQQKAVMEFFQQLEKEYGVKYLIPMPEELGK
jgi:parvulin-like peptidyl-prolyl isomerase